MRARRRTPAFMTPGKWITIVILMLLILVAALLLYYTYTQTDRWNEQKHYESMARQQAGLVEVDASSKFVWDDVYWVVKGKDKEGRSIYVWLNDGKAPTLIQADQSVTKAEVANLLRTDKPDASIDRIQPGMLGGRAVWEVFYRRKSSGGHYYYDFYDFRDGAKLGTYTLPSRIAEGG